MARDFDLLGDPIPEGRGEPGRTGHIATAENVSRVRVLLLAGLSKGRIADELGVSLPTLNKHYFAGGRISLRQVREMALAEARARNLLQLERAAATGNVSAIKAVGQRLDRLAIEMVDGRVTGDAGKGRARGPAAAPRARPTAGRKALNRELALQAEDEMDRRYGSGLPN